MTATEVMERSADMAILLGATYGRLQSELLTPLIRRAYSILRRRGEIADIALDGRTVMLEYRAPLARAQAQRGLQDTMTWLKALQSLGGGDGGSLLDVQEIARSLAQILGVPETYLKSESVM